MRVLLMSTPVPTHLTPQIPLAWALRAAGHEVVLVGQPDLVATAHSAGLAVSVVGEPFCVDELLTVPDGQRASHAGRPSDPAIAAGGRVWFNHARYLTGPYLGFARSWGPDLILADRLEYSSLIVGAALGIPVVQHRWGVDVIAGRTDDAARRALGGLARRFGLERLPVPDLVLDPAPRPLQVPDVDEGTPIRYVPFNGVGPRPDWVDRPTRDRRICVSFGTRVIELNGIPVIRAIVEAMASFPDVEAVVTLTPALQEQLGDPGVDNVRVVAPVPLSNFLDTCEAVVHHGGAGTVLTAATYGCSHLVMPQIMDQFAAADVVRSSGVGTVIEDADDQERSDLVRAELASVLGGTYAAAATDVAQQMAATPSPLDLVATLEALAGGHAATTGRAA